MTFIQRVYFLVRRFDLCIIILKALCRYSSYYYYYYYYYCVGECIICSAILWFVPTSEMPFCVKNLIFYSKCKNPSVGSGDNESGFIRLQGRDNQCVQRFIDCLVCTSVYIHDSIDTILISIPYKSLYNTMTCLCCVEVVVDINKHSMYLDSMVMANGRSEVDITMWMMSAQTATNDTMTWV